MAQVPQENLQAFLLLLQVQRRHAENVLALVQVASRRRQIRRRQCIQQWISGTVEFGLYMYSQLMRELDGGRKPLRLRKPDVYATSNVQRGPWHGGCADNQERHSMA